MDHREGSPREIARRFRVRLSFLVRLLQHRRDAGTLEPKPHRGGPPPCLGPDHPQRLAELSREPPDATVEQLRQRGGFPCSLKTRGRAVRQRRLTLKKKGLHAREQDRPEVQEKRRCFRLEMRQSEPKRLVFGDETGVTTAMTPTSAWAPRGARAVGSAPAAWETGTVIAALRRGGVRAPLAFPGATDTAAFQTSVDQAWVPGLHQGDGVVLDHLKPPRVSGVAASLERAGARGRPWPPSSPDSTPIEERSSKVKPFLRRVAARTKGDLYDALGEALKQVTPQDIRGWFKEAGLCATHG